MPDRDTREGAWEKSWAFVYTTTARIACEACGVWVYPRRPIEGGAFAFPANCDVCGEPCDLEGAEVVGAYDSERGSDAAGQAENESTATSAQEGVEVLAQRAPCPRIPSGHCEKHGDYWYGGCDDCGRDEAW